MKGAGQESWLGGCCASSSPPSFVIPLMSRLVFRCFKTLERAGDKLTGAAGPFFVAMAIGLVSTGTACFCECFLYHALPLHAYVNYLVNVIAPSLSYPLISVPICILFALNLWMHYYYVCTVPPGFVDDPPRTDDVSGAPWRWAKPKAEQQASSGVRWTSNLNITKARHTRCKRCGLVRPEVSSSCTAEALWLTLNE
jgi:palmitoyltransferase